MTERYNGAFTSSFKTYDSDKTYSAMNETDVSFDPEFLTLSNITDIYSIMNEINALAYKLYKYGSLLDAQTRILQQLEDEFDMWKATKLHTSGMEEKSFKSEKAKDRYLMMECADEYNKYIKLIGDEKYKVALLTRVVSSLEKYGYKLHDLKDYNIAINRNS